MGANDAGRWLAGARRMRGYLSSDMAADAVGFDRTTYREYESAARTYSPGDARKLADRYGVTVAFLKKGLASTLADRRADNEKDSPDPARKCWTISDREFVAERLKTVRLGRGFRMMSVAALVFDWDSSLYAEAEAGRRCFSHEQIEAYAYAYAVPVEFFTDSGVPIGHHPQYFELRDSEKLKQFVASRVHLRDTSVIWIPLYKDLASLCRAMGDGSVHCDAPDDHLPVASAMLKRHGCPEKDVVSVRARIANGYCDLVLTCSTGRKKPRFELVVHGEAGPYLDWKLIEDSAAVIPDTVLRLPAFMVISTTDNMSPR